MLVLVVVLLLQVDFSPNLGHLEARLLTGRAEGNYAALGSALAEAAEPRGGRLEPVTSAGAVDNLVRLQAAADSCEVSFGLSQAGLPLPEDHGLSLVGRLRKSESLFLLGRDADDIAEVADLRGQRIGIGPEGSGTAALMRTVFGAAWLADLDLELVPMDLADELSAVQRGELDLAAVVIDEDAALVTEAVRDRGLQIASFDHLDVIARRYEFLWAGRIGAGQFDPIRMLPAEDKRVLRVDTLVLTNGCAGHAQTVAMLELLSGHFSDFVRHNAETPNGTGLPLTSTSEAFFSEGGPAWADRWLPWLVDIAPPSNWVYIGLVLSVTFNVMGVGNRFRLWRIDVARVGLEARIAELLGGSYTPTEIAALDPADDLDRPALKQIAADLDDLRLRCRRASVSFLVPMGQEMAYRYQEETMNTLLGALRTLAKAPAPATTTGAVRGGPPQPA